MSKVKMAVEDFESIPVDESERSGRIGKPS